jgi:putative transposase
VIVKPVTVLSWHRKLVTKKWDHGKQGRVGRVPIKQEIRDLVVRIKRENPRWGYLRITGEMRKLRIHIAKNSVRKILKEAGLDPGQHSGGISWFDFMRAQGDVWACDFFEVENLLKKINVFFVIDVSSRAIVSFGVGHDRSEDWLRNHLASTFSFLEKLPAVLISDRDGAYGSWLAPFLKEYFGITLRQIPPRRPVFNCFAE